MDNLAVDALDGTPVTGQPISKEAQNAMTSAIYWAGRLKERSITPVQPLSLPQIIDYEIRASRLLPWAEFFGWSWVQTVAYRWYTWKAKRKELHYRTSIEWAGWYTVRPEDK